MVWLKRTDPPRQWRPRAGSRWMERGARRQCAESSTRRGADGRRRWLLLIHERWRQKSSGVPDHIEEVDAAKRIAEGAAEGRAADDSSKSRVDAAQGFIVIGKEKKRTADHVDCLARLQPNRP